MWTKVQEWYNRVALVSTPREPEDVATEVEAKPVFEFQAWPKTPRLLRDIVITEKIDGTNAAVLITELTDTTPVDDTVIVIVEDAEGRAWAVGAQSRNRIISLAADNQGFAKWVLTHAADLVADLGPGRHFGEFWGNKIARGYGLPPGDRRFSLFNPAFRFGQGAGEALEDGYVVRTPGLDTVPILFEGEFDTDYVRHTVALLEHQGSKAAPGYPRPEGIVVYHTHARKIIGKVTLDAHDQGKWEVAP